MLLAVPFWITSAHAGNLKLQNSIQSGLEYDSNVFKTYQNLNSDYLAKILLKSEGDYSINEKWSLGWDYQGGGKKFTNDTAQDQIIQSISTPVNWSPNSKVQVHLDPDFKYQNERNKLDAAATDINEDFYSSSELLRILIALPHNFYMQPYGSFTYFKFQPNNTFSFLRELGGISLEKKINRFGVGTEYIFFRQQFRSSFRKDTTQEISVYAQYLRNPFLSLRYSFQTNNSNDPIFSYDNHKISFLSSFVFGKHGGEDETNSYPLFSIHLIATLQLKNYPSVFGETQDGERFLVTSSEDENFNNLVVKFNYHFQKKWSFETKYTRISNELTSQQIGFSRSMYYAGLRYDF